LAIFIYLTEFLQRWGLKKLALRLNGIGAGFLQCEGNRLFCLKNYYAFSKLDPAQ
jgi:hypothetical protein